MLKALALGAGGKADGYSAALYYMPTPLREDMEVIVSHLGEEVNWKLCGDAHLNKAEETAKVRE